ncbi:hypothetical protein B0H15DRAFT_819979 [Mycena belliarum]|uniref:DUF7330 domain-containing protein n=1 Tax=Mycena belliarum TaxID=1033014 RepID=A0AAD6UHM0_9AGAR|nr:hypothetical protein B0H15DRAFT_819979 [Mycena belliae]
MIITGDAPKSPKASTPLLNDAGGSGAPPPAYAPRSPPPVALGQAPYRVYQPAYPQQRTGTSAARRFCVAFLVALGIWILMSVLLGSIFDRGALQLLSGPYGGYPVPRGVDLEDCIAGWSESSRSSESQLFPYSAKASFDLALPSETLLLLSEGALSAGNLRVTTSSKTSDSVRVNVVVSYHSASVRDLAKVCLLKRDAGEGGVGIFTPRNWRSRQRTYRLYFDVELILPAGSAGSPVDIHGLTTDVHNFGQDLEALQDIINFGQISLKGSNGRIRARTLGASNATISTSNGAVSFDYLVATSTTVRSTNGGISGTYVVADSLDLTTSNGAINVAVGINGSESVRHTLGMTTSNNVIDALVNLDTYSGTGGDFRVAAKTSNGRLTTRVGSLPLDAVLTLDARTSNSAASAVLPATFEGKVEASTSNAPVVMQRVDGHERDPACEHTDSECKGRSRTVQTRMISKQHMTGSVYWDKKNEHRGTVHLRTSNSPVTLNV